MGDAGDSSEECQSRLCFLGDVGCVRVFLYILYRESLAVCMLQERPPLVITTRYFASDVVVSI